MKTVITILLLIISLTSTISSAEETVTKISDTEINLIKSDTTETLDYKVTVSTEVPYTLEELYYHKTQAEQALASWQEAKVKIEDNIAMQTEQIAMWDRVISEAEKLGVKDEAN